MVITFCLLLRMLPSNPHFIRFCFQQIQKVKMVTSDSGAKCTHKWEGNGLLFYLSAHGSWRGFGCVCTSQKHP